MPEQCECARCERKISGKPEKTEFFFNGLRVSFTSAGLQCRECTLAWWQDFFEKSNVGIFLIVDNGTIKADWPAYFRYFEELDGSRRNKKLWERANWFLLTLGVLSESPDGNCKITGENERNIGPRLADGTRLFFTGMEDAIAYALLAYRDKPGEKFGGTGEWEIRRIAEVIRRRDVVCN